MIRIGLTGGIGSGKSLVAKILNRDFHVPVVDADAVARKVRAPGSEASVKILSQFGTLDPKALRALISADPKRRREMESLLHPLIQIESEAQMKQAEQDHPRAPFILYEASLLIEAGRAKDFHSVILVTAPESVRIERIIKRDHCSSDQALQMIRAQNSDDFRRPHCQFEIQNAGNEEELRISVQN